eukprot:CAMPEP_0198122912 /NCGR_PEP_ID=MMETSP1442-20131203/36149_1 /TAXON_ID= /ORGANISM="Craspedostauros australis, Strain CCMP3328" /LENGTH=76 /DNA_ID=CAMNT_0043782019 /DNA_START=60 /DNA_END=290 /DNA_ORIENTATION=-
MAGENIWHQARVDSDRFYRQTSILARDDCYTFLLEDDGNDGVEFLQLLHDGQIVVDEEYGEFGAEMKRTFGSLCEA